MWFKNAVRLGICALRPVAAEIQCSFRILAAEVSTLKYELIVHHSTICAIYVLPASNIEPFVTGSFVGLQQHEHL